MNDEEESIGHIWRGFGDGIIVTPIHEIKKVRKVALGQSHSLILTEDGEVYGVGSNTHGQLGNGKVSDKGFDEPIRVEALREHFVRDVACGPRHSAAVLSNGEVYMWGNNEHRQCGIDDKQTSTPQRVAFERCQEDCVHGKKRWTDVIGVMLISCGDRHTAALSERNEIWVWGSGIALGLINVEHVNRPTRLEFFLGKKALSVVCGENHTMAIVSTNAKDATAAAVNGDATSDLLCPWCNIEMYGCFGSVGGDESVTCPLGLPIQSPPEKISQLEEEIFNDCKNEQNLQNAAANDGTLSAHSRNESVEFQNIDLSPSEQLPNDNSEKEKNGNWEVLDSKLVPSSDVKIPVRAALKAKLLRSMSESGVGTKILATAKTIELATSEVVKLRSRSESIAEGCEIETPEVTEAVNGEATGSNEPERSPTPELRPKSGSLIDTQSAKEFLAQRLSSIASAMSPSALSNSKEPVFVYEATTEALRQNVGTLTNMVMSGVVSGVKNTVDRFGFVSRHLSKDYDVHSASSSFDGDEFEIVSDDGELVYMTYSPQLTKKMSFTARAHSLKMELKRKMSRSSRVGSLDTSLNDSQDAGFFSSIPWTELSDDECAMLNTEVWTWGKGSVGQLGQGDGMDRLQPSCIKILSSQHVVKVVAGMYHSLALTAGGRVYAWGCNSHGQLGNPNYTVPACSPQLIQLREKSDPRKNPSTQLDSSAFVWDIAAGNKHSVLLAERGVQTGIYYCGKQEGPLPSADGKNTVQLSGVIGTSQPLLVPILENDFVVRQVFAGGFLCSCIADSTSLAHLVAIRELAASERCFYQTLTLLSETVLEPLSKNSSYAAISSSPYGPYVQDVLKTFKDLWEQTARNNLILSAMLQRPPHEVNVLRLVERVIKSNAWISAFEHYATAYLDLNAMNGLLFCAKMASNFFAKSQPFRQEIAKTKNLDDKTIAQILARLLEEPLRRVGEYKRSLEVLAEQYKESKTPNFRELDAAERWGQLEMTIAFEKEMAEKTKTFWDTCPMKLAENLRTGKRRIVRDSKTTSLNIPGSGRFTTNWFILFNDTFVHSQFSGYTAYNLALVWTDFLSDSEVLQNAFTLTMPEETLTLQCTSPQEKTEWIHSLNQAINLTLNKPSSISAVRPFAFGFSGHHMSPPLTRTASHTFTKNLQFKDATYTGTWVRAKLFGHGELSWPDGRKYTGKFKQNVQHGDGLYVVLSTDGNTISEGMWRDGKMNGLGSIRYPNGDLYEGYFKDGSCHGHGILKKGQFMSSGGASIYIGEWACGHRNGYGVMDDIVTGEKYMGMWQDDYRHGLGMVVTLDGIYYEGNFVQNKMTGQGLMIFEDQSWYEGEFGGTGGFNGKGTLTLRGGDKIEGQFYGNWNDGIKVNGTVFKSSLNTVVQNAPNSFGQLSVMADDKWGDIFHHCYDLLGVVNDDDDAVNSQRLWETVAVIVNEWKKKLQRDSGRIQNKGTELDGLEKIPQCRKGKLTIESYGEISSYLTKAFDSSYHPLGKLLEGLVDVYRATYIGVGAHPRLLIHAVGEVRSFIQRIYRIVRLLFPDLPLEAQEQKIYPAASKSPCSDTDDDDIIETEVVTSSGLILPILLPRIYPPLFTLYALHNEKDDNKYWEALLKWNKQSDLALMAFLGVDHKFWFTSDGDQPQNDHQKNLSSIKDQHFSKAVDALQHLSTTFSPMEKLKVIHRTFQEINKEVQLALGEDYMWTMDDLFPVFQYVVVRARIRHLGSEVHAIEDLMESHIQHGELGIMFTTLKACYFQVKQEQSSTS